MRTPPGNTARRLVVALLAATVPLLGGAVPAAGSDEGERSTYAGTIDGAGYRAVVPADWNGTLLIYSHPEHVSEAPSEIRLTNREEAEDWFLGHGYALAGSDIEGRTGFVVEDALQDQIALLDWFDENIGEPERTIATGSSMGAEIAVLLAERNPERFDGVVAICGPLYLNGIWNAALDIGFVIRTLLAPDQRIELVRPDSPESAQQSRRALQQAVAEAAKTAEGRARLALANAIGGVAGWNSAIEPEPDSIRGRIRAMATLDRSTWLGVFGPSGRVDLERRAGGNPTWNIGVDYRKLLNRGGQKKLVRKAYRKAGLDLRADLERLADTPRIDADPAAVDYMRQYAVPSGTTEAPVITLHNTGDGVAIPGHERWYQRQVRRHGDTDDLRQLFVGRGTHCAFTAAEEIATVQALEHRIGTGRWSGTGPDPMNDAAGYLPEEYQQVYDFPTDSHVTVGADFEQYRPDRLPRPSR